MNSDSFYRSTECDIWKTIKWSGTLKYLDRAAAMMFVLGDFLSIDYSRDIQIVIRRHPKTGQFEIMYESLAGQGKKIGDGTGKPEGLDHAAKLLFLLGNMLFASDEKIRVTIDRNPDSGQFEIIREILIQQMEK